jgi:CheY-like chemotaxis protein
MGLAVVHGIVLRHGGAITADSTPGQGTCFEVFLPALETDTDSSDAADRALPKGTEHILLVDDEAVLRTVIGEMLEEVGYRVTRSGSGQEALATLKRDPADVDLLLSDLTMPDMTGDLLTREALAVRPGLKVLLSTGHGGEWSQEQARALGAHDLLLKPISFEGLARAVRAALDGRPVGG